ncbi:MAG: glycosyltransferase family 2 protein [Ginsengibacter sp.]
MHPKKVDIIVVNWNSGNLTMQAIAPYLGYSGSHIFCNVIVIDNASTDNSLTLFKNRVNNVIVNTQNLGFGRACNQAFNKSDADYILLLNPDTLSKPTVLEELVQFLEKNPEYGIAGPAQVDKNEHVLRTCGRFPTFRTALFEIFGLSKFFPEIFTPAPAMTDWNHLQSGDVDHVMGSYMLVRKSILDKIGFMDEKYFVYMEDIDLSKRINNAGFKAFYNNKCSIFHEGGGTGQNLKAERLFYSLSSRGIYWKKHLGKTSYFILTLFSFMIEPFLRMIDSLYKQKKLQFKIIGKAYCMHIHKLIRPGVALK